VQDQEIAGTALTRVLQVVAQAQYQLTAAVAIYAEGFLQVWSQNLGVDATDQVDKQTTVQVQGEASSSNTALPFLALAGVHFMWGPVNLSLGGGYGNIFVPRLGATAKAYKGFVPDLDFYVRF
jgi:hypothetical protein